MTKVFKFITELLGWFQIILGPLFLGLIIGAIIYFNKKDTVGLTLGIAVASLGLIIGVVIATRIWKKKGTVSFLSRISETPELDDLNYTNQKNNNDQADT